jgi:putative Mn2+ efflux pump MntP
MGNVEIILIAIGLAMDASAVSMAAAAAGFTNNGRAVFRLAFHFGLFQCFMPIAGWALGVGFVGYVKAIDHWIAFFLLALVGIRMIWEGCFPQPKSQKKDPSRGLTMVMLSVATSIDALAVGLSFAMLEVNIWRPAILIGVITAVLSYGAIILGRQLGQLFGSRMEIIGGMVLIGIGFKILLVQHAGAA